MDSIKYNMRTRLAGESAAYHLSEKAAKFYSGTEPLTVFEYENEEGGKRYAYSYADNPYTDPEMHSGLTFERLQKDFEEMQTENERLLEADGETVLTANPGAVFAENESQKYLKKIEDTSKQLTGKEKELLSPFFPLGLEKAGFTSNPDIKAVKAKYGLSWSQLRKTASGLVSDRGTGISKAPEREAEK